ncbi:MAG TPA: TonB-dependent receptor [Candidatus Sulfotelmatobacter sp.]|nr:TonB-dependent receptor [Candidatus Sulfotelmatobacter sp.]
MSFRYAALLLLLCAAAEASEIKGKVTNAMGGEPLGRVQVTVLEAKIDAVTSVEGDFDIHDLAAGSYTLRINAVGYRLITIPITLASADDTKELSITLVPDNFHHTDRVEVHGDVFQTSDSPATNETTLTSSEIREASTVFADDPFRAVQALPGVSAAGNNEFFAEFSVMGAPFSSVSIYIDDVLAQSPFHEIGNFSEGASLGVLTSEVVEEMKLMPAAYPEKFGDADGAALDIHTREGSRAEPLFRVTTGIAATEVLGEGGLGSESKGSWLLSARKSYINYLIKNRLGQNAADVSFEDADMKLNYDLTPRQNVSLFATDGHTNMEMNDPASLNSFQYASGNSDFTLARAGWRWSASPRLLLDARAAYYREPDRLFNTANVLLTKNDHREWVGGAGLSWAWAPDQVLQAGWSERQLRDSAIQERLTSSGSLQPSSFAGSGLRQSGYLQESSALLHGRMHVLGSLRWDSLTGFAIHPFSPQISLAMRATSSTEVQFGAGMYQQSGSTVFERTIQLASLVCLPFTQMPEKSDHFTAAIEQRLGENTRLRLQVFDRQDSWPFGVLPGVSATNFPTPPCPSFVPLPNSTYQRDYSRGVQLIVQRRSANRLSGWLGYTLARAQERQYEIATPVSPFHSFFDTPYYPTLEDQRHSLNAFAMYRLRPSLSLSGKLLYGSGFPVPSGTYTPLGNGQYVQTGINTQRLGAYQRLDIRADKDWAFHHWKLTLYGEVLNLTNHYNARYFYTSPINSTGQVQVQTLRGLPTTPTAGLAFQF